MIFIKAFYWLNNSKFRTLLFWEILSFLCKTWKRDPPFEKVIAKPYEKKFWKIIKDIPQKVYFHILQGLNKKVDHCVKKAYQLRDGDLEVNGIIMSILS